MTLLGANEASVNQLVKYIKDNITELNNVYLEFPNHNEALEMPSCSVITSGNVGYRNEMPILWKKEADLSYYKTGSYNYTIVIDLWTEYKQSRGDIMEKIFDLFNKQFQETGRSLGASLNLVDYHNVIAHYSLNGYNYVDNEQGSQRDEWRARITCEVDFSRITTKVESDMTDIQLHNEIAVELDNDTDEIKQI